MFKIILSNLWHRRKANGWLFAEFVIVTILLWFIIDPSVVTLYNKSLPLGYDADRLVLFKFSKYDKSSPRYDAANDSADVMESSISSIYRTLKSHPAVESATLTDDYFINSSYIASTVWESGNAAVDTLMHGTPIVVVRPGTAFYETYGITVKEGGMTQQELSEMSLGRDVVITEEMAQLYWPGENAAGKRFVDKVSDGDTTWRTVKAVVSDTRFRSTMPTNGLVFTEDKLFTKWNFYVVARLREGEDRQQFTFDIYPWALENLNAGNYYVDEVTDYDSIIEDAYRANVSGRMIMMLVLYVFFLINVVLGTIGTMWLQTRRRIRESGVLRSFGATRSDIMRMLIGESFVLYTVAFILADLIYMQFGYKFGLNMGFDRPVALNMTDSWVIHFWSHFGVLSLIVYIIMLVCVLVGTYLPARKLSRVSPVEALRYE